MSVPFVVFVHGNGKLELHGCVTLGQLLLDLELLWTSSGWKFGHVFHNVDFNGADNRIRCRLGEKLVRLKTSVAWTLSRETLSHLRTCRETKKNDK